MAETAQLARLPSKVTSIFSNENFQRGYREGIEVEKGIVLNEAFITENMEKIGRIMSEWTAYPDIYLDLIRPTDDNFELFFFQRITLRAVMRYKGIYVTAPRAFSKSFITILGLILQCIFIPGTKRFICAPNKNQSAQIAKEKIAEIYEHWPLIRKEVIGGDIMDMPGNFGKDYVKLTDIRSGNRVIKKVS
jgi:hypothetical protein